MTKELETKKQKYLAETQEEKLSLLKNTYAKDLNNSEFALFVTHAKSVGLDPLKRQIYAVKRGGQVTFQTGIDGLRSIAARSGAHAGTDEIEYIYEHDKLVKAKCTVYKIVQGHRVSFIGTAKWNEFYPGDKMGHMWKKMGEVMLGKCAEAQALRRAFPEDLSELYIDEEMQQAEEVTAPPTAKATNLKEAMGIEEDEKDVTPKKEEKVEEKPKKDIPNHAPKKEDLI